MLPPDFGTPPNVKIIGALLTGMRNATFIANGGFSGDGTGNYIAFTNGPHGWGTIAPGHGDTLIPTGRMSTDNRTPGNFYGEFFHGGHIIVSYLGNLPFGPNGATWQIVRTYSWRSGVFREVSTSQYTAHLASGFSASAPPLPNGPCRQIPSGTYVAFTIRATARFSPVSPPQPYLPISIILHLQGESTKWCRFAISPDFQIVISANTDSGFVWITAPAWVMTGDGYESQSIANLLSGTRFPGQYGLGAVEFQNPDSSPYYIPLSLGIRQISQLGSALVTVHKGRLTKMVILPL